MDLWDMFLTYARKLFSLVPEKLLYGQRESVNAVKSDGDILLFEPDSLKALMVPLFEVEAYVSKGISKGITVVIHCNPEYIRTKVLYDNLYGIRIMYISNDLDQDCLNESNLIHLEGNQSNPIILYITPEQCLESNTLQNALVVMLNQRLLARFVILMRLNLDHVNLDWRYDSLNFLRENFSKVPITTVVSSNFSNTSEESFHSIIKRITDALLMETTHVIVLSTSSPVQYTVKKRRSDTNQRHSAPKMIRTT
jgi:hypothetical protein